VIVYALMAAILVLVGVILASSLDIKRPRRD